MILLLVVFARDGHLVSGLGVCLRSLFVLCVGALMGLHWLTPLPPQDTHKKHAKAHSSDPRRATVTHWPTLVTANTCPK